MRPPPPGAPPTTPDLTGVDMASNVVYGSLLPVKFPLYGTNCFTLNDVIRAETR